MLDAIVIEKFINGVVVSDNKWNIMELKKNTTDKR